MDRGSDGSLVSYVERGLVAPCRALVLGCGTGRDALRLASHGFAVDAVDPSATAVASAAERARETGVAVRFHHGDVFALGTDVLAGPYELVHDSGCFGRLPPWRRIAYRALRDRVLAPGGHLALTCPAADATAPLVGESEGRAFRDDGGDACREDGRAVEEAEGRATAQEVAACTAATLRLIFLDLTEIELRRVAAASPGSPHFGSPSLWAALFRRDV
ncbi:class I SAM-dependent methyltransferase [Streptantibioticus parmotrematis]|uniref:class I SAM-dependent methyltransferase n=1 Tax=Streptantibioticus parmotrematis TaxID=2873249 RepID=UPI0033F97057